MAMVVAIIVSLALPVGDQDIFPFISPRSSGTANGNLDCLHTRHSPVLGVCFAILN
jgi:hypothetical protein